MDDKLNRRIVFIHPDLGIGGAERLVVDAAVGLQERGHKVTIFTNHCDQGHCFDEARNGILDVRVRGNSLIPPYILGHFTIVCAILRQLHLIFQIQLTGELSQLQADVFFIDQLSTCIPLLRHFLQPQASVLFYCHFPDKLLVVHRDRWWKRWYRLPFDWLEEFSTGAAHALVVNSRFTRDQFRTAFASLRDRTLPVVVYPCVDTRVDHLIDDDPIDYEPKRGDRRGDRRGERRGEKKQPVLWNGKRVLLSINRFERKKGVDLAVRAFAGVDATRRKNARLVIAGGHDPRVQENVSYHHELVQLAESVGLRTATAKTIVTALNVPDQVQVLFLLSVTSTLKTLLLDTARLLVYTPADEHFGIVPLEAMVHGLPVLAANSGGPLETVVDGQTGWSRDVGDVQQWSQVMDAALRDEGDWQEQERRRLGENGPARVRADFSREKMAESLEAEISRLRSGSLSRSSSSSSSSSSVRWRIKILGMVGLMGLMSVVMVGMVLAWGTVMMKWRF